jgi:hypothetical protein
LLLVVSNAKSLLRRFRHSGCDLRAPHDDARYRHAIRASSS